SQVVLRIRGEHEFPLTPLGLPSDETVASVLSSDAAQLFVRRASAARPDFEVNNDNAGAIGEICRLLDGLPLALELAAARTRLLSLDEIVTRLKDGLKLLTGGSRDAPSRHQTLRAALDWSYELLSPTDQAFFRAFSVFEGGADLGAVEAVIDVDTDPLDCLTKLVEHSLIRRSDVGGRARFSMLQTIRTYARELLAAEHGDSPHERHASYYLQLAESLAGDRDHALDRDMDNFRTALDWWVHHSDRPGTQPLRLATALGRFWYRHGHAVEGIGWFEQALAVAHDPPAELHASALRSFGVLVESAGELERARGLFEEALDRFRASGSQAGEAASLNSLGVVLRALGDLDAAETRLERAIELRTAMDERSGLSASTSNLGITAIDRGDFERAKDLFETALALDRKLGDEWAVAVDANNLAVAHLELTELDEAGELSKQALRAFSEYGDKDGLAEALEVSAGVAGARGRADEAARLAGAADSIRIDAGLPMKPPDRGRLERWLMEPRSVLGDDAFQARWDEGAAMTIEQAVVFALRGSTESHAQAPK
ncbi:MAG TPA: tetratricopeptide repeat protein, partial [Actinomycetota bacterium]|nr:tetratricopeptide repeat protein [Actinomycetota bacterium]